jgi:signal transduction histidine kinase/ActR/RegA family two-component response regulator
MTGEKLQVRARDVMRDIRAEMSDSALMQKYRLSPKGLESLFKELLYGGIIEPSHLRRRSRSLAHHSVAVQEDRMEKRLAVDDLLPIHCPENPDVKGIVIDISARGLMVKHLDASVDQIVGLVIPATMPLVPNSISFDARCKWIEQEPDGSWLGGFEIATISPDQARSLKKLIDTLDASLQKSGDFDAICYDSEGTQTVDLTSVFPDAITSTGSFAFSGVERTWFGKLLQALPNPAVLINQSLRIVFVNRSFEKLGGAPDRFLGKEFTGLFPDSSMSRQAEAVSEQVFKTRQRESIQGLVGVESTRVWCRLYFQSVRMGTNRSLLVLFEDLTAEQEQLRQSRELGIMLETRVKERTAELEKMNARLQEEIAARERVEQELLRTQKLESLGVVAGGIAHDFNNILAALQGAVSLAKIYSEPLGKAFRKLEEAEKAIARATDLTSQLLTFSKGGAPVRKPGPISAVVRDCSGFALRGSNVKCEFDLPPDLWTVEFDEGQISQVINNIVINADNAMPDGGIIRISAENAELLAGSHLPLSCGKYVKICVEDQGIGIPVEHLHRIFDPYFTTKQKGHGLGLATAHSIIKRHGGLMTASSEFGTGTTIMIYLPATEKEVTEEPLWPVEAVPGQGKILVMDDEKSVRDMAEEMLSAIGYSVTVAEDGREAIELFTRGADSGVPFDVVILDLTVAGGMGGKATLAKLREIDPKVKAVVSSGYCNDPIMSEFQRHGFDGVLPKPYNLKELSHVLAYLLPLDCT